MNRPIRSRLAAASLFCAALAGCAAPGGLGQSEAAPPVSSQPQPKPLWPLWSTSSATSGGSPVATRMPPPKPLEGAPPWGPGGSRRST